MSVAKKIHPKPDLAKPPSPFVINQLLLPIKVYYFVFMAGIGALLPFVALYMKQLGFNSTETGIIYGFIAFIGVFVKPAIGGLADKYHQHKLVLITITIITGLMYTLLVFVPRRPAPHFMSVHTTLECNTQDSFLQDCDETNSTDNCNVGLSHLTNLSSLTVNQKNASSKCLVECQGGEEDFQACFTNDTTSFNGQTCNGILRTGKHLDFTVNDLQSVLNAEITQHTPAGCNIFDLKDVYFDKETEAWQILCDQEVKLDCRINCASQVCEDTAEPYDKSFFLFFAIFFFANVGLVPVFPILDAATYDLLGEQRHLWGKQRLWGTLGFAMLAVTSTFVMYFWHEDDDEVNYSYCFYIFGVLTFIAAFLAKTIQFASHIKCNKIIKNMWELLSFGEVSFFLFVVTYFGFVLGGMETFLFWYLSELGGSSLLFGFMLVVSCSAEVPMLWIAGSIMKRIGMVSCLYLALLGFALRFLAYSLLQEPWYVLLVEPIHSVTYGLMYSAASSYASYIAPPGMSATVQGIMGGLHFGFGKGIGSLATGTLFDNLGPRWTWRLFSIASIVVLIIYFMLNKFVFTSQNKSAMISDHNEGETHGDRQLSPSTNEAMVPNYVTDHDDNKLTTKL